MQEKLTEWAAVPDSVYKQLLDKNVFTGVKLDDISKILYWDNIPTIQHGSGTMVSVPPDIDPEVLYEMSNPVGETGAA